MTERGPDTCEVPLPAKVPCGRRAVAWDVKKRRLVCKFHAPWYPEKLGRDPKALRPSPCCGVETDPVLSGGRQTSVVKWERCRLCRMVWDLGVPREGGGP